MQELQLKVTQAQVEIIDREKFEQNINEVVAKYQNYAVTAGTIKDDKQVLNGYTVEKEKLYTVDLPNGQPLVRGINTLYFSQNLATENVKLTESEIRKDFEWAWQFAEEVTE